MLFLHSLHKWHLICDKINSNCDHVKKLKYSESFGVITFAFKRIVRFLMKKLLTGLWCVCVLSMMSWNVHAVDLNSDKSPGTLGSEKQILNALMKTIKDEGYVLLNLHRDNYTLVIPTSNNFSRVLQNLQQEDFLSEEQLNDFSLLWDKTRENGGIGVLEHKKIQTQGQEIARRNRKTPEIPRKTFQPGQKDEIYNYLQQRAIILKEVVEYHKAINKAKAELDALKKERETIQKRILFLKKLMANSGVKQTLSSK